MPINVTDLTNRVQDGYIGYQSSISTDLHSGLRGLISANLTSGTRNVTAFSEGVIDQITAFALRSVPGITDQQVSQFIQPMIDAANDLAAGNQGALGELYGLIDQINNQSLSNAARQNTFESIAGANVTGTALPNFRARLQDLNGQYGLGIADLGRLKERVESEVSRRYIR